MIKSIKLDDRLVKSGNGLTVERAGQQQRFLSLK